MPWYFIVLIVIAAVLIICTLLLWFISRALFNTMCNRKAAKRGFAKNNKSGYSPKKGYKDYIHEHENAALALSFEELTVCADDGTSLFARYFPAPQPSNKLFIGCHGFASRGTLEYGQQLPFWQSMGFNVLLPDMRAHGKSGGAYIGYGVLDRDDVMCWLRLANERFGPDVEIILAGSSMGGGTVLMLSDRDDLENVRGIISDCGIPNLYLVCCDIIKRFFHLPARPLADFVRFQFRRKLGYDINDKNTLTALKKSTLPVLLLHGTKDTCVNFEFSRKAHEIDPERISLVSFDGSDHVASHYNYPEKFEEALRSFVTKTI